MFGFRHKLPSTFFQGACDVHCHLLPGVDDGFGTLEQSLSALQAMEARGVEGMMLTPHFMKEYPENNRINIMARFEAFKAEAAKVSKIKLKLAAEYMLDAKFLEHFRQGFLTLEETSSEVLCETSYMMYEQNASEMIYEIMLEGFQPVIAHPERYEYATKGQYFKWRDKRYKFQLNLLSLAGAYGKPAAVKAHFLLGEDFYDYVGTDMHRLDRFERHLEAIRLSRKDMDRLERLMENNKKLFR